MSPYDSEPESKELPPVSDAELLTMLAKRKRTCRDAAMQSMGDSFHAGFQVWMNDLSITSREASDLVTFLVQQLHAHIPEPRIVGFGAHREGRVYLADVPQFPGLSAEHVAALRAYLVELRTPPPRS